MRKFLRIIKKVQYVKEPFQVYMCTKYQVDILKNDRVLVFPRSKKVIFHAIPCNFSIFPIFKICPIWAIQKVFYSNFSRSWRKTDP